DLGSSAEPMQLTLSDIVAGGASSIGQVPPGGGFQSQITQVCWDPTCTSAAPAGAVSNMMSVQLTMSSPNTTDLNAAFIQLTVRFLNGSQVTFEEQETGLHTNSQYDIIP